MAACRTERALMNAELLTRENGVILHVSAKEEALTCVAELTTALKAEARRLGFELVGMAPAVTPTGLPEFLEWLERGCAREMRYLQRREEAYEHPRPVLDGARTLLMPG